MDAWWIVPAVLAGAGVGVLASLGWARAGARAAEARLREQVAALEATLEAERRAAREQRNLLDTSRQTLSESFRALSADVLQANSRQFLELARTQLEGAQARARAELEGRSDAFAQTLKPLGESLAQVQARLRELEQARVGAYEGLREQVANLLNEQKALRGETRNLVGALRQPTVRGRWGEIQLRRVVELAGMLPHCDFLEQQTVVAEDARLRPDLMVRLPGGGVVVVDAKVPLQAYLDALEAPDEATRAQRLAEHARHLRGHVTQLARRGYAEGVRASAPFVVMFVPGDLFFNAALEQDPSLLEAGVEEGVLIATPTSLIALLRAVAHGWRQEQLARNAAAIAELGRELHGRLATLGEHWAAVGKNLRQAVEGYNRATGSLETRVMVTARRLESLDPGLPAAALRPLEPVESLPRLPATDASPPEAGTPEAAHPEPPKT
jgi:DNA recombination protein RmuC